MAVGTAPGPNPDPAAPAPFSRHSHPICLDRPCSDEIKYSKESGRNPACGRFGETERGFNGSRAEKLAQDGGGASASFTITVTLPAFTATFARDPAVVTVDEQGSVTAVAPGTATITVKDADDKASARAEIKVFAPAEPGNTEPEPGNTEPEPGNTEPEPGNTEPEPGNTEPEPQPVTLSLGYRYILGKETWPLDSRIYNGEEMYDLSLAVGESIYLIVIGTDNPVHWITSTSAVTISEDGIAERVSVGTAILTAEVDGQTVKCVVN